MMNKIPLPGQLELIRRLRKNGVSEDRLAEIISEKINKNGFKTWEQYEKRVQALEKLCCDRSDAQGIADSEVESENFSEWR